MTVKMVTVTGRFFSPFFFPPSFSFSAFYNSSPKVNGQARWILEGFFRHAFAAGGEREETSDTIVVRGFHDPAAVEEAQRRNGTGEDGIGQERTGQGWAVARRQEYIPGFPPSCCGGLQAAGRRDGTRGDGTRGNGTGQEGTGKDAAGQCGTGQNETGWG